MAFTSDWFENYARAWWEEMWPRHFPDGCNRALEIGSYEGAASCWLLRYGGVKSLLCVDTWGGSDEPFFEGVDMREVQARFTENVERVVTATGAHCNAWQTTSREAMKTLLDNGAAETFDFVYIDGSHVAKDVLADALQAFRLLRPGGWMYFDDYNWINVAHPEDPSQAPAAGIDAFINIKGRAVHHERSNFQMHVQKL